MRIRTLIAAAFAALACALPATAQTTPEQEVRAVVDRMFNGMRAGDSTAVRAVFHPQARLQSVVARGDSVAVMTEPVDGFVQAVGAPHEQVWDERISNVEIRVDGEMATAWMNYAFHLGDRFSHCGVNAFQFVRTARGWQVVQIIDTRRRQCGTAAI
ncbi:nuclear transport factor 2 family protein [Longimicrobium terrae]|uniref:Nuclear transport factor 2 family protein n=1 Tax=Longimicrobium terrae TaxID=1639882 RepID=A0A841H0I6_9BACT|nr:nuclear transport factor 2 family protein [Longimicrobium terrae]MBB4637226.1 hypothetical protein [Longimicrobium terrae]MBB6071512.1 hypothetical protein [Longimicrobium terrae]NNC30065.1 SnoaL-like domain-containing protein [Longimicrobium terrae]